MGELVRMFEGSVSSTMTFFSIYSTTPLTNPELTSLRFSDFSSFALRSCSTFGPQHQTAHCFKYERSPIVSVWAFSFLSPYLMDLIKERPHNTSGPTFQASYA
ncbi:Hypothetical predicted protein [Prunus dulcis]|uniref:Uncharacterized protein n=1 Tax=Prunus dulcis TaxID=3755 RepID=A0A5E4E9D7_PRUDU|nr:Hypothetical predicted protein [Prunus dulcis]